MSGHGHDHGAAAGRAGARHAGRLRVVFAVVVVVLVVEAVAAVLTNSLALLSDAAHMLTDAVGLGMALAAVGLADRMPRRGSRTYGLYRLEILAALANALLLLGAAGYVIVEAFLSLQGDHEVDAGPMLVVAIVGLVANGVGVVLLREGARESLNVEGAFLEVLADLVGSVGVVVAGIVVLAWGWTPIDAVVGAAIGLWILPRTLRLAGRSLRILLQMAPPDLDVATLEEDLAGLPGVVGVHDLHVWTLTSEMEVASAHLVVGGADETHAVLDRARAVLSDRYGIDHATLQVEPSDHTGCEELEW
ncbi:MAG: cation diffusion facilitator family transporter [Acidimicrobiia bacterium]|nr:cation diffusion facilitator family transporter [Acidimicrobiia bacterium]